MFIEHLFCNVLVFRYILYSFPICIKQCFCAFRFMLKMYSVRKQRDTNSLRVAGVKAAGQTPISIILNMGSISCSPESTEDECNGIVQGDSTPVKQYSENNDCLETGHGDVGDNGLLKMRGNCSIFNYQEMLKGKDKIEGKVWEGYSVHGNENVLTVDQKVVELHVGSPTTDQTPSHDKRPATRMIQSPDKHDERLTTDVAHSLDERPTANVALKTQSTKNKFQLTMKENVKILPDPMTSPERILDVALGRKSSSRFSPKNNRLEKLLLAFFLILVISVPSSAASTHLKPPGQKLPRECFDLLETDHGNDCPQYGHPFFDKWYKSLNETCCRGYQGKTLHCQMNYEELGDQYSMVACLTTVDIPEGYSGRILDYGTSNPFFVQKKLNDTQSWLPARESWQVTLSYHPHAKIRCEGPGQQLLCLGVKDNLCTCQLGFNTTGKGCKSGFGAEDACVCRHLGCSVGYHAARNFSKQIGGNCSDLVPDFTAEFICEKNPIPASTISSTTQSTFAGSSTTSHPPNTTRAGGDDDGKKDSKTTMIVLVVVFLLIVLILVVLVIKYWAKLKAKLSSLCSCGNVIVNCLKSYGQCSDGSSEPVDGSPGSVFLASASESVV